MYTFDQGEVIEVSAVNTFGSPWNALRSARASFVREPDVIHSAPSTVPARAFYACTGLHKVMGHDLVVRDRRQDILYRSNHGDAELKTSGTR